MLVKGEEKQTIAKKGTCLETPESPYVPWKTLILPALLTESHLTFDCFKQSNSVIYQVATKEIINADIVGNNSLHSHVCNPKFSMCSTTVNKKYMRDSGLRV